MASITTSVQPNVEKQEDDPSFQSSTSIGGVPKKLIDCYWFLQNQCVKGEKCEFRHFEDAKNSKAVCEEWMKNNCKNFECKAKHPSGPHLLKATSSNPAPCFYFSRGACMKGAECPFSHAPPVAKISSELQRQQEELRKIQEEKKKEQEKLLALRMEKKKLEKRKDNPNEQNKPAKPQKQGKFQNSAKQIVAGQPVFVKTLSNVLEEKKAELKEKREALLRTELNKKQNQRNIDGNKGKGKKMDLNQRVGAKKDSKQEESNQTWRVKTLSEIQEEKQKKDQGKEETQQEIKEKGINISGLKAKNEQKFKAQNSNQEIKGKPEPNQPESPKKTNLSVNYLRKTTSTEELDRELNKELDELGVEVDDEEVADFDAEELEGELDI